MENAGRNRTVAAAQSQRRRLQSAVAALAAMGLLGAVLVATPALQTVPHPLGPHPDLGQVVPARHVPKHASAAPPASSRSVAVAVTQDISTATVTLGASRTGRSPSAVTVGGSGLQLAVAAGTVGPVALSVSLTRSLSGAEPQITLRRTDGEIQPATIAVTVPDALLNGLFGANYASRVQWMQNSATVVSRRDTTSKSTVLYPKVSASPTVMRASSTATSSSGNGTFTSTPLNPASGWQVSTQTGDFAWNFPLRTPPAAAGPAPSLTLAYDSQALDGETGSTNNQPGVIGDGWNLGGGGFIERSYIPCAQDDGSTGPKKTSGDQCWRSDNATVSFGGHSGAAIKDATAGTFHLQDDDNSRLEHLTGTSNGTYDGDYWRLTTTDGTQYYFGLNQLPGYAVGNAPTNSVNTEPVYGNDPNEPCHGASFAASSCTQAWRWNLDYVVDPHNNAEAFYYNVSTNLYGANNAASTVGYVRDSVLDHIDYGLTSSTVYASNAASDKVLFAYTGRCATTGNCDSAHPTNAPDTPWDQNCTAAPCSKTSPSFWSTAMLATVTTEDRTGTNTYSPVDTWTLNHSFPDPGDGQSPALWLASIDHLGDVGTAVSVPSTVFAGIQLQNRVTNHDGLATFNKLRINGITTELGAKLGINYSGQDCTSDQVATIEADLANNNRRCFPQWWVPQLTPPVAPIMDLFHKYVVTSTVSDPGLGSQSQLVTYNYTGTPAWRYDLSAGTPTKERTWSDYAGYDRVEVQTGSSTDATVGATDYLYYRGMYGDRAGTSGGAKPDTVVGSDGEKQLDSRWLAGQLREQQTLTAVGGSVLTDVISTPWSSAVTANDGTRTARIVDVGEVRTSNALAAGGTRTSDVTTTFDGYGRPLTVNDYTPDAGTTCTTTSYAAVSTAANSTWMFDYPSEVAKTAVPCAQTGTATYPAAAISDVSTAYDGGAVGAAPTKGEPTGVARVTGYTGTTAATATWQTTATSSFDILGRVTAVTDQLSRTTKTAYTPAGGGPLTGITVTNPMLWTSSTTVDPAWGAVTSSTDANNHTTTLTYDGLGRRLTVWAPDDVPSSTNTTPTMAYTYNVPGAGNPNVVTTDKYVPGSLVTSYTLLDGLGQTRQTQAMSEGGGSLVTDTTYDSLGRPTYTTNPYPSKLAPSTSLIAPTLTVPSVVRSTYDGVGRQTASILVANNTEAWRTTTSYTGTDTVAVTPPTGGTPTTTVTDSRGDTTSLTQWLSATPGTGTAEKTTYGYDAAGRRTSMTDPTGKDVWTWGFDALGRTITASDPDTGTTRTSYDDADRPTAVTDGRHQTITTTYDALDRPIARYSGPSTGPQLAAWSYDMADKGQLDTATTYVGSTGVNGSTPAVLGTAYSTTINTYDAADRPTKQTVTLPTATGAMAGSYTTTDYYFTGGLQLRHGDPAEGGIAAENLIYGHDELGNLDGMAADGATNYLTRVKYDTYNRPAELVIAPVATTYRDYSYDNGTGRLTEDAITITQNQNGRIADDSYTYDNAGDLTSDTSVRDTGGPNDATTTQVTDTQCYTYDQLQNLTQAWTPASNSCATTPTATSPVALGGPAPYWQSWKVDPATGNRTKAVQHSTSTNGASRTDNYTYAAAGTAGPHAVSSVAHTNQPAGGGTATVTTDNYGYDSVGNRTSGPDQTLTWDPTDHLSGVTKTSTGQSETKVYTPDGSLLYQSNPVNGAVAYLGDTELHITAGSNTVTGVRTYTVPGIGTIAERVTPPVAGYTASIVETDIRGTNIASVGLFTGAVTQRYVDPFGGVRGSVTTFPDNHLYLNAPATSFDGTTHMGARDYDPAVGSFLSVDPVLQPGSPSQNNGYSYAHNNPTSSSDPSGLMTQEVGSGGTCTVFNGCAQNTAYSIANSNYVKHKTKKKPSWAWYRDSAVNHHRGSTKDFVFGLVSPIITGIDASPVGLAVSLASGKSVSQRIYESAGVDTSSGNFGFGAAIGTLVATVAGAAVGGAGDAAEAAGAATDAAEAASDGAATADTVPNLAAYGGGKTSGVLVRGDGTTTDITSGLNGPSKSLPKPRPGMNGNIVGHVEAHAAAIMRSEGLPDATLYINRMPCGGANGCMVNLSRMVPTGSTLDVYVMPGGSSGAFEDWVHVTGTG